MIENCVQRILEGEDISFEEALKLAETTEPTRLFNEADKLRDRLHDSRLDLCSIVNARSGKCSENCKFCAQSAHYNVEVATYDIVDLEEAVRLAKENESYGVERFSLVTAGRSVSMASLEDFQKIYARLRSDTSMKLCASMGFLTPEKAEKLKAMGVQRYHCNLETCRSFFPNVCTTHSWDEKVATIRVAQQAGLEVCSGGIIGLGESFAQRLELAFELRELGIQSIPINILTPIKDTPFEDLPPLSVSEILTCIAMFRFINPRAIIRLAGGRNLLGDRQDECFRAGANGSIVGNYLTTVGNGLEQDIAMFERLGFAVKGRARRTE